MTTENPFDGREHGGRVFRTRPERNFFIGRLSPSQQKEWLRDHPERWQTREDALRDLQARVGVDVEAGPAEPHSTTSANEVRTSGASDGPLPAVRQFSRLPVSPQRLRHISEPSAKRSTSERHQIRPITADNLVR